MAKKSKNQLKEFRSIRFYLKRGSLQAGYRVWARVKGNGGKGTWFPYTIGQSSPLPSTPNFSKPFDVKLVIAKTVGDESLESNQCHLTFYLQDVQEAIDQEVLNIRIEGVTYPDFRSSKKTTATAKTIIIIDAGAPIWEKKKRIKK